MCQSHEELTNILVSYTCENKGKSHTKIFFLGAADWLLIVSIVYEICILQMLVGELTGKKENKMLFKVFKTITSNVKKDD